jgi:hypothetical protein
MLIALRLTATFLALGRADVDADAATGAIVGSDLDGHLRGREIFALASLSTGSLRSAFKAFRLVRLHADRRMGQTRASTWRTRCRSRDPRSGSPWRCCASRYCRVGREGAVGGRALTGQVALACQQHRGDALDEFVAVVLEPAADCAWLVACAGHLDFVPFRPDRAVHGSEVLLQNRLASFAVGLLDRVLDLLDRFLSGRMLASAKKQVCMTVLMRTPMPASRATLYRPPRRT